MRRRRANIWATGGAMTSRLATLTMAAAGPTTAGVTRIATGTANTAAARATAGTATVTRTDATAATRTAATAATIGVTVVARRHRAVGATRPIMAVAAARIRAARRVVRALAVTTMRLPTPVLRAGDRVIVQESRLKQEYD